MGHWTKQQMIETIRSNYPPENYSMLREALDYCLGLLEAETTMGNGLKPCPFCGGKPDEDDSTRNRNISYGTGWIGCRKCRVFMDYTHGERGRKLAVEAWNRRADNE